MASPALYLRKLLGTGSSFLFTKPPSARQRASCPRNALLGKGRLDEAIAAYRAALRLKNDYPKAHSNLGYALMRKGRLDEAIACYREALRLQKDFPEAHSSLGTALKAKSRLDEAIAEHREALRLKKDYPEAHYNLGNALERKGQLDEAIAEYREAIRLKKDYPEAHNNLGNTLRDKGQLDEAIAACREALRLKKEYAEAHSNLGLALYLKGRPDEAITEYREAIRLKKDYPEAHCNLGGALQAQGKFREALEALRRGHELGARTPAWRFPSAQWVRQCERLVELNEQLPAILEGKKAPASPAERLELAQLCSLKRLHRAAVRFYEEAFAASGKLAERPDAHRYNAACAAALAGCGIGQDADKLDGKERAGLRRQALDWLRADLMTLASGDVGRGRVRRILTHWQKDTDLAAIRDKSALARLPRDERRAFTQLWADVAALIDKAADRPK